MALPGQIAALDAIDVARNRCERRGRLNTARLVAGHGAEMRGPVLVRILAVDCPRMQAAAFHDVCGVHLPQLSQGGLREGQPLVFPPICAILLRVERITHAYLPKHNAPKNAAPAPTVIVAARTNKQIAEATPIQRLREYGH